MSAKKDAIQRVRDVRHQVSSRFEHDPLKVIEHYRQIEMRLRDRLLSAGSDAAEAWDAELSKRTAEIRGGKAKGKPAEDLFRELRGRKT